MPLKNDEPSTNGGSRHPAERFLELMRKRITHDLRGPLGTIVNYAAILEDERGADHEQVRDYARRMRTNAMRAAAMLQSLSAAISIVQARCASAELAPAELVRQAAEPHAPRAGLSVIEGRSGCVLNGRSDLASFCFGSFCKLAAELAEDVPLVLHVDGRSDAESCELQVRTSDRRESESEAQADDRAVDLERMLRDEGRRVSAETGFALRLAADLAVALGARFELRARPGAPLGAALRWPARS